MTVYTIREYEKQEEARTVFINSQKSEINSLDVIERAGNLDAIQGLALMVVS